MIRLDDTIVALATAEGEAGLAVARLSGAQALQIAGAVFRGAAPLAEAPSHTLHHGWLVAPDDGLGRVDEVVAAVFRAPRSYTRENVVEISCHGGRATSRRVLEILIGAGARAAGPGEFTLRAFLNGRLDLAQAEAVADLIQASTEASRRLAFAQLEGRLSRALGALHDDIADAAAEIEARVDFAEDVGGLEVPGHVLDAIARLVAELDRMLASAPMGRALREGARVPLVGRPNAGKSSLFNALLGEARAIVAPLPGTTRDRVSEPIELEGIAVTLSDTAGLREAPNPIEALGVGLTESAIEAASTVVWVVDATAPLGPEDAAVAAKVALRPVVVALNKTDRPCRANEQDAAALLNGAPRRVVRVSALTGAGLDGLREAIADLLGARAAGALDARVSNPRHAEALASGRDALQRAHQAAAEGEAGEIVALELREAMHAVGQVTGRTAEEDLLERIFSRFCVGK